MGTKLPNQFEPELSAKTCNPSYNCDSEQSGLISLSNEDVDHDFERANACRLRDLGVNAVVVHDLRLLNVSAAMKRCWSILRKTTLSMMKI